MFLCCELQHSVLCFFFLFHALCFHDFDFMILFALCPVKHFVAVL